MLQNWLKWRMCLQFISWVDLGSYEIYYPSLFWLFLISLFLNIVTNVFPWIHWGGKLDMSVAKPILWKPIGLLWDSTRCKQMYTASALNAPWPIFWHYDLMTPFQIKNNNLIKIKTKSWKNCLWVVRSRCVIQFLHFSQCSV